MIGQDALFRESRLDEPWDSPRNKALLERMSAVYAVPGETLKALVDAIGGHQGGGANAVFCDGWRGSSACRSTRACSALITRDGGEVVSAASVPFR